MIIKTGIVLIALVVIIVGVCVIYGRSLVRTGREKKELHRRRVEDAEREEYARETFATQPKIMHVQFPDGQIIDRPETKADECELEAEDAKSWPPGGGE